LTTESPPRLCPACGGPLGRTSACAARPGLLTFSVALDDLVLSGDLTWMDLDDPPTACPGCSVDLDQPCHAGCDWALCEVHRTPRDACDCDARWLADAARIPWYRCRRWPQLRRPRWRRRGFLYGEEIVRSVPDAHPKVGGTP
jgi:hypothetical protein